MPDYTSPLKKFDTVKLSISFEQLNTWHDMPMYLDSSFMLSDLPEPDGPITIMPKLY